MVLMALQSSFCNPVIVIKLSTIPGIYFDNTRSFNIILTAQHCVCQRGKRCVLAFGLAYDPAKSASPNTVPAREVMTSEECASYAIQSFNNQQHRVLCNIDIACGRPHLKRIPQKEETQHFSEKTIKMPVFFVVSQYGSCTKMYDQGVLQLKCDFIIFNPEKQCSYKLLKLR